MLWFLILLLLSATNAQKRLQALSEEAEQLKLMVEQVRQLGMDPAYPLVGVTVVSDFIQYVQEDLQHGEVERAFDQISQMESVAQSAREQLQSAISEKIRLPEVPRYVTSPINIEGPSFIADAHFPVSGRTESRPIFFTGHGHFSKVRSDLEKLPGYGINIIQIEFGPRSIFPEEGKVSDAVIKTYLKDFDRAAESGVSVCLLISPHYMPEWGLESPIRVTDADGSPVWGVEWLAADYSLDAYIFGCSVLNEEARKKLERMEMAVGF